MVNDTIAAISSAPGKGAIAVIRVSGKQAFPIFQKIIHEKDITKLEARRASVVAVYSDLTEKNASSLVDHCIVLPYIGPHSYTGEDVVEIFSHGGHIIPGLILEALIQAGCRMAEPGEFTRRAFLNGKIDLIQAESVDALISASSKSELRAAHQHHSGQFSREINELRSELIDLLSLLELELDFAEEDVEFADREMIQSRLQILEEILQKILASYDRLHMIREGLYVAIVGRPNVGKSSLLNLILKKERAIVTNIPGTTRDIIEESVEIHDTKFVFVDTAGIRGSSDIVEQEGMRRSRDVIGKADIILFVVDASEHLQKEDWELRQILLERRKQDAFACLVLLNKNDLPGEIGNKEFDSFIRGFESISFSCKTGDGMAQLQEYLRQVVANRFADEEDEHYYLINIRQKGIVARAYASIQRASEYFAQNLSQEFIASELRLALDYLGELIGKVTTEDILGNIFSKFCIGK